MPSVLKGLSHSHTWKPVMQNAIAVFRKRKRHDDHYKSKEDWYAGVIEECQECYALRFVA